MMNEPLSTIMTRDIITLKPEETLEAVKVILRTRRIHHLPVVDDDGQLLGIVSTYDLFKLEANPSEYAGITVRDIMTTGVAVLEPSDKIGAAAEVFLEHLFHAVPIVENGHLMGIVTSFDILKYEFKKEYPNHVFASS